jgi:hypothetical protein
MTLGTYAMAVTADKRQAQDVIAALFVGKANDASALGVEASFATGPYWTLPRPVGPGFPIEVMEKIGRDD